MAHAAGGRRDFGKTTLPGIQIRRDLDQFFSVKARTFIGTGMMLAGFLTVLIFPAFCVLEFLRNQKP